MAHLESTSGHRKQGTWGSRFVSGFMDTVKHIRRSRSGGSETPESGAEPSEPPQADAEPSGPVLDNPSMEDEDRENGDEKKETLLASPHQHDESQAKADGGHVQSTGLFSWLRTSTPKRKRPPNPPQKPPQPAAHEEPSGAAAMDVDPARTAADTGVSGMDVDPVEAAGDAAEPSSGAPPLTRISSKRRRRRKKKKSKKPGAVSSPSNSDTLPRSEPAGAVDSTAMNLAEDKETTAELSGAAAATKASAMSVDVATEDKTSTAVQSAQPSIVFWPQSWVVLKEGWLRSSGTIMWNKHYAVLRGGPGPKCLLIADSAASLVTDKARRIELYGACVSRPK